MDSRPFDGYCVSRETRRSLQHGAALQRDGQAGLIQQGGRETLIAKHLQTHRDLEQKAKRLQEAPGIGFVGAVTLLGLLPELGIGSQARISSLAGLAPRDHDSGTFHGARRVHGGRPKVRRILYLCALSAVRYHPRLKTFYTRLRAAGKAPKVALTAAARKLLTYLHAALKNPNFKLA